MTGGRIERFFEKHLSYGPGLVNAGLYHLGPDIFEEFPDNAPFSIETDIFPTIVEEARLSAIKINADFIDIGIPEDYERFCKWMESGKEIEL